MNKIGLHFNYWNGTGAENNIYDALDLTARTGADVFEYGTNVVLGMSKSQRKDLKNAITDQGLLSSINGGIAPYDMAADDIDFRRKSIDEYKRTAEVIAEMSSPVWSGVNYSKWLRMPVGVLTSEIKRAVWDIAVESVREFVKALQEFNVVCCFEVVNRYEHFVLNTAHEGVEFLSQIKSPYTKLLLDTFHMNIEEDNIADAIFYAMEHNSLGHIHLGESNRRLPGTGKTNLNWAEIFNAVKESGYSGYLILEPLVLMGTPLARSVNVWRDIIDDKSVDSMTDAARESISFVRHQLSIH